MYPVRRTILACAAALLGAVALPAHSQNYPTKPVRFIVPFPPGGPVDATARAITFKLSEYWKQQAIVDNRAGAGGIVGAEIASKSPADGYTVFVCSIHHSVLPSLRSDLSYNIEKDFVPVTFATQFPIILVAHPSVQAKSVKELIAYAKANPGKLSYGSAGNGGGTHLAGELFKDIAHVDLLHVPYKGSAPAMTDLLGGQVQLMFSDGPTALPQIKGGKVRALAVGSPKRSALAPDVPTMGEAGLAGYDAYSWSGIVVPAATPKEIVAKLNA
ncbi:MAG TPA: tripartite tricarboxylate transporter substrate binding protein, partial [Burkholderiales bacterium]|nr:tripartite tricarboxylate transporter substrate binding protein [Burkholderiales bacterium]